MHYNVRVLLTPLIIKRTQALPSHYFFGPESNFMHYSHNPHMRKEYTKICASRRLATLTGDNLIHSSFAHYYTQRREGNTRDDALIPKCIQKRLSILLRQFPHTHICTRILPVHVIFGTASRHSTCNRPFVIVCVCALL